MLKKIFAMMIALLMFLMPVVSQAEDAAVIGGSDGPTAVLVMPAELKDSYLGKTLELLMNGQAMKTETTLRVGSGLRTQLGAFSDLVEEVVNALTVASVVQFKDRDMMVGGTLYLSGEKALDVQEGKKGDTLFMANSLAGERPMAITYEETVKLIKDNIKEEGPRELLLKMVDVIFDKAEIKLPDQEKMVQAFTGLEQDVMAAFTSVAADLRVELVPGSDFLVTGVKVTQDGIRLTVTKEQLKTVAGKLIESIAKAVKTLDLLQDTDTLNIKTRVEQTLEQWLRSDLVLSVFNIEGGAVIRVETVWGNSEINSGRICSEIAARTAADGKLEIQEVLRLSDSKVVMDLRSRLISDAKSYMAAKMSMDMTSQGQTVRVLDGSMTWGSAAADKHSADKIDLRVKLNVPEQTVQEIREVVEVKSNYTDSTTHQETDATLYLSEMGEEPVLTVHQVSDLVDPQEIPTLDNAAYPASMGEKELETFGTELTRNVQNELQRIMKLLPENLQMLLNLLAF